MTVYAATETPMGATAASFSRLNGYCVVAKTAQKAVDTVRAARPFFAGIWGCAEVFTPDGAPAIPANRSGILIHPDQLYFSVERRCWCYRPESLLDPRYVEELSDVRRFLEIPKNLLESYPVMRRTPLPDFSKNADMGAASAKAGRAETSVADARTRRLRIRRGD